MSQETERYQLENNGNSYLVRTTAGGGGADVEANPEGTATADLEKLKVGETIYGIPEGTEVVANPTLAGTESALTGLQVGDTKYAVESGMTNPMTAEGDIIYGGASGTPARCAIDATGSKFLSSNGIVPLWTSIIPSSVHAGEANKLGCVLTPANSTSNTSMVLAKVGTFIPLFYTTTAPTADNTDGIKIVVLSSEPSTRYNGYLYIITA